MDTEIENKSPAKPTGRRYASVSDMIRGENIAPEVHQKFADLVSGTDLARQLAEIRQLAGLTQEEMAQQLGCTQGAVSKLESSRDEDLTLGIVSQYAKITGQRVGLVFGPSTSHVESVKGHALCIKEHLSALATLAHKSKEMETPIRAFFGEAFFNILDILSTCQDEMPATADRAFEIHVYPMPRRAVTTQPVKTSRVSRQHSPDTVTA